MRERKGYMPSYWNRIECQAEGVSYGSWCDCAPISPEFTRCAQVWSFEKKNRAGCEVSADWTLWSGRCQLFPRYGHWSGQGKQRGFCWHHLRKSWITRCWIWQKHFERCLETSPLVHRSSFGKFFQKTWHADLLVIRR